MEITKETLYGTRYIDPERTLIGVMLQDPETKEITEHVISTDPNLASYKTLLDLRTVEQLDESHNNWIDAQSAEDLRMKAWLNAYNFTPDQLKQIASGEMSQQVEYYSKEGTFTWEEMINGEVPEENVFKLKLAMFEDDDVQNSKKTTQKSNLRKATTVTEAFYYYGLIKGVNGK